MRRKGRRWSLVQILSPLCLGVVTAACAALLKRLRDASPVPPTAFSPLPSLLQRRAGPPSPLSRLGVLAPEGSKYPTPHETIWGGPDGKGLIPSDDTNPWYVFKHCPWAALDMRANLLQPMGVIGSGPENYDGMGLDEEIFEGNRDRQRNPAWPRHLDHGVQWRHAYQHGNGYDPHPEPDGCQDYTIGETDEDLERRQWGCFNNDRGKYLDPITAYKDFREDPTTMTPHVPFQKFDQPVVQDYPEWGRYGPCFPSHHVLADWRMNLAALDKLENGPVIEMPHSSTILRRKKELLDEIRANASALAKEGKVYDVSAMIRANCAIDPEAFKASQKATDTRAILRTVGQGGKRKIGDMTRASRGAPTKGLTRSQQLKLDQQRLERSRERAAWLSIYLDYERMLRGGCEEDYDGVYWGPSWEGGGVGYNYTGPIKTVMQNPFDVPYTGCNLQWFSTKEELAELYHIHVLEARNEGRVGLDAQHIGLPDQEEYPTRPKLKKFRRLTSFYVPYWTRVAFGEEFGDALEQHEQLPDDLMRDIIIDLPTKHKQTLLHDNNNEVDGDYGWVREYEDFYVD
ncbi:unnamed protein product [Vitrella brassicaformis CCMP3155]|uniref:Uncharacterized protein n=2 Tax=Vitrella brassicaformis TaxID=1169539 RepID=A0A0G4H7H6_VITBC|nr:unnamed protein product [Vitrella brassicaformis CCMP3155]|eukprot:CEM39702.1 unnamed protein product [Vitrella brassicaformis CCMP3155]